MQFKIRNFALAILMIVTAAGCGGGSTKTPDAGPVHLGNLPQIFLNELGEGSLRASLEVYGPDGALEYNEGLEINEATGEIFSSQFQLATGFTYTFVITFHYTAPGLREIPVAFVVKVAATEGDFLAVFFEEGEIMTSNGQLSPEVSASLSTSNLPNLDEDGDGFDNFSEFREKSDPFDPNSIPAAPELIDEQIANREDFIAFSLTFRDASGISSITPVDPYVCGFYEWKVENVGGNAKTQKLTAKFNLHAHAGIGDQVTLKVQVNDILGLSQTYDVDVDGLIKNALPDGDPLDLPQIAILSPQNNETVSDFVTVNAVACDEDGISSLNVEGLGLVNDNNALPQIFDGVLDTTSLGDGPQNITIRTTDTEGRENFRSVQIVIGNQNPIKIDVPQPGQVLKDGFTVAAHVDKRVMPNVANLFIEAITDDTVNRNEIFELNQLKFDVNSLPESFTGQIFNTSNVQNQIFVIRYVAVGTGGEREEREVRYRIDNFPFVNLFAVVGAQGPDACLVGGRVDVAWDVNPLGVGGFVNVNGSNVSRTGDSKNFGTGSNPPAIACDPSVELTATRIGIDQSTGEEKPFTTSREIKLSTLVLEDSPEFYDSVVPDDFRLEFSVQHNEGVNTGALQWELEFFNVTQGQAVPGAVNGQGLVIDAADFDTSILEPRTDYLMTVKLMGAGGQIVSQKKDIPFTTGDVGLIGWWRMDGTLSQIGSDSSGHERNAFNSGVSLLTSGCAQGNCGGYNSSDLMGATISQTTSMTLEAWVYWDSSILDSGVISKDNQYGLRVEGSDLIFSVDTDNPTQPEAILPISQLSPNNWYHLAAVYVENPGATPDSLSLYVNGQLKASDSSVGTIITNSNQVRFGVFEFPNGLIGRLDEIAIYDRALSVNEVKDNCARVNVGGVCQ